MYIKIKWKSLNTFLYSQSRFIITPESILPTPLENLGGWDSKSIVSGGIGHSNLNQA